MRRLPYPSLRLIRLPVFSGISAKSTLADRNLACWIYGQIHKVRNDFLHGNEIIENTLMIPESDRFLLNYAPVFDCMELKARLDLKWTEQPPTDAALNGLTMSGTSASISSKAIWSSSRYCY